jgi:hypothetical protein
MSKRHSRPVEDRLTAPPPAPDVRLPPARKVFPWGWVAGLAVLAAAAAVLGWGAWRDAPAPERPAPAEQSVTEAERVIDRFVRLTNAGDPAAADLLGPAPAVPKGPVSPGEVGRLQTDYFLREPVRVVSALPSPGGRFVLVVQGNVAAPTLEVRTPTGVERSQRTMTNPDLVVEVRDGKIHGVRAELHTGR